MVQIATRQDYCSLEDQVAVLSITRETSRLVNGLIRSLQRSEVTGLSGKPVSEGPEH
jgi:hypothetical protein